MKSVNPMATLATNRAPGRTKEDPNARRRDRTGTMIRHASFGLPLAMGSLTTLVSPSAWLGTLIAAVGRTPLVLPSFLPACSAAVALSTVTMAAHPKEGATAGGTTEPWAEGSFRYGRHRLDSAICHNTPDAAMMGQMTARLRRR